MNVRRAEKKQVSPEDSKSDCSPPRKKIRPSRATSCSIYLQCGPSHLKVRPLALQDGKLLSAGDKMAQDAKNHPLCLASLYKRAKSLDDSKQDMTVTKSTIGEGGS